jgi:putative membrane protein
MKALVSEGKVNAELPPDISSSQKSQIDKLGKLQGADFNRQHARDAVSVYKTAVSLFQRYSKGGDNPDLKAFAAKYLPVAQMHLQMAEHVNKAPAPTVGQIAK